MPIQGNSIASDMESKIPTSNSTSWLTRWAAWWRGIILRYGNQPLPDDGSLPVLNWAGAQRVGRLFIVGTPNLGSTKAITEMKNGLQLAPPMPKFPAAVVGTMPAVYQLFPRSEDRPLIYQDGTSPDLLSPNTWQKLGWGLADKGQDRVLARLMPNCSVQQRRQIALEHLSLIHI